MAVKQPSEPFIGNPDADTEEGRALLQKIVDLLLAGGYYRARISTLAPFDKLVGGLAWSITASNADVDFDLFYDDDASLGYKIKLGENIEIGLQQMECPHPLQAHQIQGLDYPAILPVVQWLVKRVILTREERGSQLRRYAHYQFNEAYGYCLPDEETEESPGQLAEAESGPYDRSRLRHREDLVILEQSKKQEATNEGKPASEVASLKQQAEAAESRLQELEKKEQMLLEQVASLQADLEKQRAYNARAVAETAKLPDTLQTPQQKEALPTLISLVRRMEELKVAESDFRSDCKSKRAALKAEIDRLSSNAVYAEDQERFAEVAEAYQEELARWEAVRKELAKKLRAVALLARKLDEIPTRGELLQYEKRFVELYEQVRRKHAETRRYFATYNALADGHKFAQKELSLLNSIHQQFEAAIATPGGRAKLVESMKAINAGVQQSLERTENKLAADKSSLSSLQEKYNALVARQRQYCAIVKQFQEQYSRNEELQIMIRKGGSV